MGEKENCYNGYAPRLPKKLRFLEDFPMPTAAELEEVNSWFPAYVFYKTVRDGRELTTSCCGRKAAFYPALQRTETEEHRALMQAKHNDAVVCPFCGRPATLKSIGRKRDSFRRAVYEPFVVLREREGDLMAVGILAAKGYEPGWEHLGPRYHITNEYHFSPGRARMVENWYGKSVGPVEVAGSYSPRSVKLCEPFTDGAGCMYSYSAYRVIGLEAIGGSAFRYCGYERFKVDRGPYHTELMKFLALCCVWPRDVEMLLKSGARRLVDDIVSGRRKNADVYRWGAADVKQAFGMDGQELRLFAAAGYDLDLMRVYKCLRRGGFRHDIELCYKIVSVVGGEAKHFIAKCRSADIEPVRVMRWLSEEPLCARYSLTARRRYKLWGDYISFCERLGYDLRDETVFLPRDFMRKHDEAAEELKRREQMAEAARYKQLEKQVDTRARKYDFAMGGLFIRVARTFDEVVAEGNTLKHCVGGYAGRHMEGKTTILFLREEALPDVPMVTVEMDGNQMRQAHGYRNDLGAESPLKTYKEFFDAWLAWLKRGSPRNKDGTPRIRRKKGESAA